jgi:hypothetical protein
LGDPRKRTKEGEKSLFRGRRTDKADGNRDSEEENKADAKKQIRDIGRRASEGKRRGRYTDKQ